MRVNLVSFPITFSVPLDCQEVIHLFYLHCWKLFDLNRRCLVSFGAIGEESSWPLQGKQDEKWQLALLLRKAELVTKIRQREQRTKNKGRVTVTATVWWVTKAELVTKTVSPALRHGLCDQLGLWAAPEFWQRQGLTSRCCSWNWAFTVYNPVPWAAPWRNGSTGTCLAMFIELSECCLYYLLSSLQDSCAWRTHSITMANWPKITYCDYCACYTGSAACLLASCGVPRLTWHFCA